MTFAKYSITAGKKPWERGADRAISLGELMKIFNVNALLGIVEDLYGHSLFVLQTDHDIPNASLREEDRVTACALLDEISCLCLEFGFTGPNEFVKRSKANIQGGDYYSYSMMGEMASELRSRIKDEFADVILVWIEEPEYRKPDLFGEAVSRNFPSASVDIEEAGSCYALGRYTACVFHLMRVTECGLRAVADRVAFPDPRGMWEPMLRYINTQMGKKYDEMPAVFRGDLEFIAGLTAHMHAVNVAWRRRVAHFERTYTKEQAKRIFDATKGLMEHLAEKLSEVDEVDAQENRDQLGVPMIGDGSV
jgi:hypothetical protein